jgi:hypothetical protein
MLRHLKSLFVALGVTTAGAGVAAADEFRGTLTTVDGGIAIGAEVHVGTPTTYSNVDYRYGYGHTDPQPGPGYVIPSSPAPGYVAYPRDLRPRRGFTWVPARYESRYGRVVYVPGHWERIRPRRGFVWVEDHVEYRHGRAVYVPGHWERVRGRNWARGYYR